MSHFQINSRAPETEKINAAVRVLKSGGTIIYPTETFYALGADYTNFSALQKIFEIKKREPNKPFPLILSSAEELKEIVEPPELSLDVKQLILQHWPGALTLVFACQKTTKINQYVISDNFGIAVRLSSHPIANACAKELGRAITATSVNFSTLPAAANIADIPKEILAQVDLVLDGGHCEGNLPSTIVDVREKPFKIVRRGMVAI